MKGKMITQKDIARKLGISRSLVSRALTGTAVDIGASEETVRKIRQLAEKFGYVQNAAALSLRGDCSKSVGVVVKDFSDPFFGKMIREIQELGRARGFSILLTGYSPDSSMEVDINSLLRYSPDAIIICGSHLGMSWLKPFIKRGIPAVQIGSGRDIAGLSRIEMDEEHAVLLILDHLKMLGHLDIGFIGTDSKSSMTRKALFAKFAAKYNMSIRHSISVSDQTDAGFKAMNIMMKRAVKNLPSAVAASDDITALGALKALHSAGISVPDDISLVGIDDIPSADLAIPPLTTVRAPVSEMVKQAFSMAVDKDRSSKKSLRLRPELAMRESTKLFNMEGK